MGSRFLGVPLSAAEMAPKIVVPAPNSGAPKGIRAPVTVDESDFEYSGSSRSRGNSSTSSEYSGSDTEPERADGSGEDELETDTEKSYVAEEVGQKTRFVREYTFPRPFSEGKELVQETSSGSSINQRGFSRPSMGFLQESGRVKNPIFRPSVRIQDEGSDDYPGLYLSESDELVGVDDYVPRNRKFRPVVPVALISRDSDEDSQGSEVSEDEIFSGSVRVPSMEFLQRVNSAPKVRVSEVDLGVGNEPLANNDTEMEVAEDSVIDNAIVSSNGDTENDNVRVEGSSATIQEEVSDAESRVDPLFAGEVHTPVPKSEKNEFDDEEIQELDPHLVSMGLFKSVVPSSPDETVELEEQDATELEHDRDFGEVALYDRELKSSESSYEDDIESDNVQTPTQNLFCPNAAVDESVDQGVEVEDVLTQFSESSDTLIQIKKGDTSDREIQETEHCDEFAALLDASTSDNNTIPTVGNVESEEESLESSSEDTLTDQNQEIDGPIISYLDIIRSMSHDASDVALSEEQKKKLVKIQLVRVKYLRLLHRLGFSPKDSVAARVLFQLTVAEAEVIASRIFDLSYAEEEYSKFALRFDEESDFSLNILVIGKSGVGKSSTVNSIFGERKASVSAFEPTTADVKEINGVVRGVKVTVFDTPGLRTASSDRSINEKILTSIKKTVKKHPPDVVLYVDRLDESISNLNDLPMFKAISSHLGSSIWSKSILVLTHASSLPLDGPEGVPLSYEAIVSKWSRALQQLISLSCGEMMNPNPTAAVSSVENNPFPENQTERWRSELMLLCYSTKSLSEVHSIVSNSQMPSFLSSSLQSNDPTSDNVCVSPFKPPTQSRIARREQLKTFGDLIEIKTDDNIEDFLQARPVLSSNRWDHDHSYDGMLVEYELHIADGVLTAQTNFRNFNKNTTDAGISYTYPFDENRTSISLSFMRHGGELESWFSPSRRNSKLRIRAGLNGKRSGRVSIRAGGSEQLQLAAMVLFPLASAIFKKIFLPSSNE